VIGIEVRFLAGRFHGTDWHHAHNEGVPEWPPSPWRVLRALVSAAYAEDIPPSEAEPLLEKLRGLPRYRLPLAVDAHTRHYMPDTDDANHTKTKVFDAFVAVEGGARDPQPMTMAWSAELSADERTLLERLARRVAYLGRAESWAELRTVDVGEEAWNCWPEEDQPGAHSTTLLTPSPAEDLAAWVEAQPAGKKGPGVPRTLWDVLTFDADRYRDEGWSDVPGTRRARYVFARPPFRRAVVPRNAAKQLRLPTVARYAIRSAVLPLLQEAVAIGERMRVAVMSQSRWASGDARPVFSGHGPTVSNHEHAMYLATSEIAHNHGFIDHLTVAARAGFESQDVLALQRLRRLWGHDGHDLELVLVSLGSVEDFGGLASPRAPILAESRFWESLTPFVPTRHPKVVRGAEVDGVESQIRSACERFLSVSPIDVSPVGDLAAWARFRRRRLREGGGRRGLDRAVGVRLEFDRPVRGPIALGYGCHFGLGLFAPVSE
jgi:CRISPR-associated protein Csb2